MWFKTPNKLYYTENSQQTQTAAVVLSNTPNLIELGYFWPGVCLKSKRLPLFLAPCPLFNNRANGKFAMLNSGGIQVLVGGPWILTCNTGFHPLRTFYKDFTSKIMEFWLWRVEAGCSGLHAVVELAEKGHLELRGWTWSAADGEQEDVWIYETRLFFGKKVEGC